MPDKEKVIKWLEHVRQTDFDMSQPTKNAIDDALALLKEQEETINNLTDIIRQLNQHIKDLGEYMTPYGKVNDVKAYVELMKEQETVEPKKVKGYNPPMYTFYEYNCKNCKSPMMYKQPYCMGCGRQVKWE